MRPAAFEKIKAEILKTIPDAEVSLSLEKSPSGLFFCVVVRTKEYVQETAEFILELDSKNHEDFEVFYHPHPLKKDQLPPETKARSAGGRKK